MKSKYSIYTFISFYFSFAAYVNFSHTNSLYIQFIGLEICGVEQGKEESKNSQNRWINLCTFFPLDFFLLLWINCMFFQLSQQKIGEGAYNKIVVRFVLLFLFYFIFSVCVYVLSCSWFCESFVSSLLHKNFAWVSETSIKSWFYLLFQQWQLKQKQRKGKMLRCWIMQLYQHIHSEYVLSIRYTLNHYIDGPLYIIWCYI